MISAPLAVLRTLNHLAEEEKPESSCQQLSKINYKSSKEVWHGEAMTDDGHQMEVESLKFKNKTKKNWKYWLALNFLKLAEELLFLHHDYNIQVKTEEFNLISCWLKYEASTWKLRCASVLSTFKKLSFRMWSELIFPGFMFNFYFAFLLWLLRLRLCCFEAMQPLSLPLCLPLPLPELKS